MLFRSSFLRLRVGGSLFHTSSRSIGDLEIKDRGEKEKDCRSKELIKVFKIKILLEKKNLIREEKFKIDPGGYP